jgi:hypothetical protein
MVLPHQAETDFRDPLFIFVYPPGSDDIYGLYSLSPSFWMEMIWMLVLQALVAAVTAYFLYKTIVEPKRADTSTALMIGWGIVIPLWIFWPVVMIRVLDIRNTIFKFVVGCVYPVVCLFRTLECIYGFTPTWVQSTKDFVGYYASVMLFDRDDKQKQLIPCPPSKVARHLVNFLLFGVLLGILQSFLASFPYMAPFGGAEDWYAFERYSTWQLYANSLFHAFLFQMTLTFYTEGLTLVFVLLSGYQTLPVMLNPLLESKSPLDFWGRRWNLLVHHVLKNGVFRPMRKHYGSTRISVIATFLASGLFHEWLLWAIFTPTKGQLDPVSGQCSTSCYEPKYGRSIVFFLWQAGLVAMELSVGRAQIVKKIGKSLPQPIKAVLIVAMGIPVAHFFTEPYFRCGFFFYHAQPGIPKIIRIK